MSTLSNMPKRWFVPPPQVTAYFSKTLKPGVVLRVSRMSVPYFFVASTNFFVKVAVAHGMKNARVLLDQIREGKSPYLFIEIMGCPGGCINGGGQPIQPASVKNFVDIKGLRAGVLYRSDAAKDVRLSHENSAIKRVYEEYFGEPGSHTAHEVLHTSYVKRGLYND